MMRETLNGFQGGLQISGRIVANIRCTDDIILSATSEAELQELVDRLDRVSHKYNLLINTDKTKVMSSDSIACHILIQNEQLGQVDTLPYLGSTITEDGEGTKEFLTRSNGAGDRSITAENMEKSQQTISTKIRLMKAALTPQTSAFISRIFVEIVDTTNESTSVACRNVRL